MTIKYRKTTFSIEGSELVSIGYTAGERWNGWACPRFTREEADKIVQDYNSGGAEKPATYNEVTDTYFFPDQSGDEEMDMYAKGYDIKTFEGVVRVYPVGAGSWVWDDESACNKNVDSGILLMGKEEEE